MELCHPRAGQSRIDAQAKEGIAMKRICRKLLQRLGVALVAVTFFAMSGTMVSGQTHAQDQAPAQVRSRAEETAEWWNQIGKKLIAMAKDFPEDKYGFKVQKDERTFAENLVHVAAVDYDIVSRVAGTHVGPNFGKDKHNPPPDMYKTNADVV